MQEFKGKKGQRGVQEIHLTCQGAYFDIIQRHLPLYKPDPHHPKTKKLLTFPETDTTVHIISTVC